MLEISIALSLNGALSTFERFSPICFSLVLTKPSFPVIKLLRLALKENVMSMGLSFSYWMYSCVLVSERSSWCQERRIWGCRRIEDLTPFLLNLASFNLKSLGVAAELKILFKSGSCPKLLARQLVNFSIHSKSSSSMDTEIVWSRHSNRSM